jgi:hypothetical protein
MLEKPKKYSLAQAAFEVETLISEFRDDGGNLDAMIVDDFKALRDFAGVTDAVDRHLYRMGSLDMYVDKAQKEYEAAKRNYDDLKAIKKRAEDHLFSIVKSVSFPLKGTIGEITTEFSSRASVQINIPVIASKSFSNILSNLTDDEMKQVDQKFLTRTEIFTLNKDQIAKALKTGESVPFATSIKRESLCLKTNQSLLS